MLVPKTIVLILIILFIFSPRLLEIEKYRKLRLGDEIQLEIMWISGPKGCWRSRAGYLFLVPNCGVYQTGDKLQLLGRVSSINDKKKNTINTAVIQSINLIPLKKVSPIYWFSTWMVWLINLRSKILIFWRQIIGFSGGSLFFSLIFGGREALLEETELGIQVLGLSYIFSASGMHVGLLLQRLQPLIKNRSTWGKFLITLLTLGVYGSLTLWRPAIVRACLMVLLRKIAKLIWFRPSHPLVNLGFAFFFSLLINPLWWFEISFWLSYAATSGILLVTHFFKQNNRFFLWELGEVESAVSENKLSSFWSQLKSYTRETLLFGVVAQLATFPLVISSFGQISLVGLLSSWSVLWILPKLFEWGVNFSLVATLVIAMTAKSHLLPSNLDLKFYLATMLRALLLPMRWGLMLLDEFIQHVGEKEALLVALKPWSLWQLVSWYCFWLWTIFSWKKLHLERHKLPLF